MNACQNLFFNLTKKTPVRCCNYFKGKFKVPYISMLITNTEMYLQIDAKLFFFNRRVEVVVASRIISCPSSRQKLFAHTWMTHLHWYP